MLNLKSGNQIWIYTWMATYITMYNYDCISWLGCHHWQIVPWYNVINLCRSMYSHSRFLFDQGIKIASTNGNSRLKKNQSILCGYILRLSTQSCYSVIGGKCPIMSNGGSKNSQRKSTVSISVFFKKENNWNKGSNHSTQTLEFYQLAFLPTLRVIPAIACLI